jgi:hypothetical protein
VGVNSYCNYCRYIYFLTSRPATASFPVVRRPLEPEAKWEVLMPFL